MLAKFIAAQATDPDYLSGFASLEKTNTGFNVESNEVLVWFSTLYGASRRVVPASIAPDSINFVIILFHPLTLPNINCTNI